MATASDNFDRSNTDPIDGDWASDISGQEFQIKSNQAYADAIHCYARSTGVSPGDAQYSQAIVENGSYHGVVTRYHYDINGLDGYIFRNYNGVWRLMRSDNGSTTQLGADFAGTPAKFDVFKLESPDDDVHDCIVNTVSLGTRSDSTYTSGDIGIYGYSSYLDDWEGGDLGVTPPSGFPFHKRGALLGYPTGMNRGMMTGYE